MAKKARPLSETELLVELTSQLRQTARRPTIYGYKPQEHQRKFHNSRRKGRVLLGGNRAGKTVTGSTESVDWLIGRKDYPIEGLRPPIRGRAIGVDFDQGIDKIIKPEIARWIPPSMLKNGSWEDSYTKSTRTLTLTNDSFLEFMSYDQDVDKFSGTSRHFVYFDEEPPEEIFNENMARLIDTEGHWWLTMTPLIDMSWTIDRLYHPGITGENPNIEIFEVETSQNAYVKPTEVEILLEGFSEEEKKARLSGRYFQSTGTIYAQYANIKTVIEDITLGIYWDNVYKTKWGHFVMMDHGYANPACFLWGCFDPDGKVIIYYEYYMNRKLVAENARAVHQINAALGVEPLYYVGDPSIGNTDPITGTSIQIEYAEHGIPILLGNNDVEAGIARCQYRLKENLLLITRNCHKTVWELSRYRFDKFASKKTEARSNAKEKPLKRHDHAMDAMRYGIVSRPAFYNEPELKAYNPLRVATAIENGNLDLVLATDQLGPHDFTLGSDW